jgi:maltooligosyltrehalose trehalohydrolase
MRKRTGPCPGVALLDDDQCSFCVWAPAVERVELRLLSPTQRTIPLLRRARGYHTAIVEGVAPGTRYRYRLDGQKERADPASRFQPEGVHGPSEVVAPDFAWNDGAWVGLPLHDYIIYELHIGTFTPEGTFDAAIAHLDRLRDLGITAIEIMPVAEFPGGRNWGYDGTYLFSVHSAYGGPDGLRRFVNACHERGLAVVLDVVYNHFGPEGNYLWDYAPQFFTSRYQTPWGAAINFDGPHSNEVRRFFLENALMWVTDYHIDALRLDAVHAINDLSATPFLRDLADALNTRADQLGRRIYAIAESDQNDNRLVSPPLIGGYGLHAQWSDDVHHAIHTVLTGETAGYYLDFGRVEHLAYALQHGWLYDNVHSRFRQRRHGSSSRPVKARQLVVCTQNHDQVGNRMLGERLTALVPFDALKLAAATLLLSPYIPLLFMGEEYGEPSPFLYFVSHGDPDLIEAVRKGRREEFVSFAWKGEAPDPQSEETFARSRLDHSLAEQGKHRVLFSLYRELIRLRKTLPALATLDKERVTVEEVVSEKALLIRRLSPASALPAGWEWAGDKPAREDDVILLLNFSDTAVTSNFHVPSGLWETLLDTADERWQETGRGEPKTDDAPPERFEVSDNTMPRTLAPYGVVLFRALSQGTIEDIEDIEEG